MRELTLLETGYLAGLLLLSLVLPLLLSFRGQRSTSDRRPLLTTVWCGQIFGAICGIGVLASEAIAPFAFGLGVASYFFCMAIVRRKLRLASAA